MIKTKRWKYLNENGEENNGKRSRDKHLTRVDDTRQKHLNQGEADSSSQSSVSHDKLLLQVDWLEPESIGNGRQDKNSWLEKKTREKETLIESGGNVTYNED